VLAAIMLYSVGSEEAERRKDPAFAIGTSRNGSSTTIASDILTPC
jgi:hypothetical protein